MNITLKGFAYILQNIQVDEIKISRGSLLSNPIFGFDRKLISRPNGQEIEIFAIVKFQIEENMVHSIESRSTFFIPFEQDIS